jgi:poly(hydroxyalkanoate) depolymerase family esterase
MNGCWNWHEQQHQIAEFGEPSLIAGMTRQVMSEHGIDAARVYVAGMSAGGAMAVILGQAYPDLYAAVGVHSGVPSGVAVDLMSALSAMNSGLDPSDRSSARRRRKGKRGIATIVFHGDNDTVVHPSNGEAVPPRRKVTSERRSQRVRRGRTRCACTSTARLIGHSHLAATGRCAACQLWLVHGAGHA